jgi:hypothetical protein
VRRIDSVFQQQSHDFMALFLQHSLTGNSLALYIPAHTFLHTQKLHWAELFIATKTIPRID